MNRWKKKLVLFLLAIILAATFGITYQVYASGDLAEDKTQIPRQMITRINLERQANDLPAVYLSQSLTNDAITICREVRISPRGYQSGKSSTSTGGVNIFVIPRISWAISGYNAQQQIFDMMENNDNLFRKNILNRTYDSVGIGVTSDGYNYYIVTIWG